MSTFPLAHRIPKPGHDPIADRKSRCGYEKIRAYSGMLTTRNTTIASGANRLGATNIFDYLPTGLQYGIAYGHIHDPDNIIYCSVGIDWKTS